MKHLKDIAWLYAENEDLVDLIKYMPPGHRMKEQAIKARKNIFRKEDIK